MSRAGLYVILVVGADNDGATHQAAITQLWNFYAPRYKDRTSVIYEIKNEVLWGMNPYPSDVIAMESALWQLTRTLAPNTPIIAWTPGNLPTYDDGVSTLQAVPNIDYSNTLFGIHYYNGGISWLQSNAPTITSHFQSAGYPQIVTEFCSGTGSSYGDCGDTLSDVGQYFLLLEKEGLSWVDILMPGPALDPNGTYEAIINGSGVSWVPDFGCYPQRGLTPGPGC